MGSLKHLLQQIFNIGVNFVGKCIGHTMRVFYLYVLLLSHKHLGSHTRDANDSA